MAHVWSRGGYQQVPVTATAHVPYATEAFTGQSLLIVEKPHGTGCLSSVWPEGDCRGRQLHRWLLRPACPGWGSWQHPQDLQDNSAQSRPPVLVSALVAESQLTRYVATAGQRARTNSGDGQGCWGVWVMGEAPLIPRAARAAGGLRCPAEGHWHSQQSWQVNMLVQRGCDEQGIWAPHGAEANGAQGVN